MLYHIFFCSPITDLGPISPKSASFSDDTILFVSSKRKRLEARNIAVILIFIRFTTFKRTALQNKSEFYE